MNRKLPRRNATRKPVLYQRDAHVHTYRRHVAMLLGMDPEDWTQAEAELLSNALYPRDQISAYA